MCKIADLVYAILNYSCSSLVAILASLTIVTIAVLYTNVWPCFRKLTGVGSMSDDNMGNGCCKCQNKKESDKSPKGKDEISVEEILNNVIQKNSELLTENLRLDEKVQALETELEEKKLQFSEMFGKDIEMRAKDNFNNTSDPIQPVSISKQCEDMFDTEWRNVMINMFKNNEEKGIQFLSKIFQDCQEFCQLTARTQISKFINPCSPESGCDVKDALVSEEDVHTLYKIRRKIGQCKLITESVIECFYNQCMKDEKVKEIVAAVKDNLIDSCECVHVGSNDDNDNDEDKVTDLSMDERDIEMSTSTRVDPIEHLDAYIKTCTGICWQAAISDPPICFKFDVVGEHIEDVKSKFYEYPGKISGGTGQAKTVKTVVWPAVVKTCSGGREVLIANMKGCVILYDTTTL